MQQNIGGGEGGGGGDKDKVTDFVRGWKLEISASKSAGHSYRLPKKISQTAGVDGFNN